MIYVISDTHFGHGRILQFSARQKGFEYTIIKSLNFKPEDLLIHLGDMSFYKHDFWNTMFNEACNCNTVLVRGNHDKKSDGWYLAHGWNLVVDKLYMKRYGLDILFTHEPYQLRGDYDVNVHGHLHKGHRSAHLTSRHKLVQIEDTLGPVGLRKFLRR